MNSILKMLGASGFLWLLFVTPATAQIANGVDFKTTFPFWVGNAKLPAGAYTIKPSGMDESILEIQGQSAANTAMVEITPTQAESAHTSTDVTFKRYGNVEYLNMVWVNGQKYGMQVDPSKAEKKLAAASPSQTHKVSGKAK
jgi:hypothetical protein